MVDMMNRFDQFTVHQNVKGNDGDNHTTIVPTKSESDVIFCLQLLSKTFTCTSQLS